MEAPRVGFGREHFGGARLGDRGRTERLVYTAERLMRHPEGTLPQRLRSWADLMGLYRLVRCGRVTHAAVLAPHAQRTRRLMAREPVVLLLHDWTELDYTTRTSLQGLGQIGRGTRRGYVCQNTLAVTPDRRVLGLAHQHLRAAGSRRARRRGSGATTRGVRAGCGCCRPRRSGRRRGRACGWTWPTGGPTCSSSWTTSWPTAVTSW